MQETRAGFLRLLSLLCPQRLAEIQNEFSSHNNANDRSARATQIAAHSFIALLIVLVICGSSTFGWSQPSIAEQKGLPANSTFAGGDIDTVNLQNGNLHVVIPIYVDKQRGGKTLRWELIYDSPTWIKKFTPNNCGQKVCNPIGWFSVGPDNLYIANWRLAGPQNWGVSNIWSDLTCPSTNLPYVAVVNWSVTDPQGTQHMLPLRQEPDGNCEGQALKGPALDGSGIFYDSQAQIIYLKDGTQISSSEIRDANGNLYTFANNQDANGRTPVVTINGPNTTYTSPLGKKLTGYPSYTTYTVSDSGGNPQVYTVTYEAIDETSSLCNVPNKGLLSCTEYSGVSLVISSITLPDDRAYTFTYNNNSPGEIASITLPTGAVVSYTYGIYYQLLTSTLKGDPGNVVGGPAVSSRTVTHDGTSQTWSYGIGLAGPTTVTDPVGNVATHTFSTILAPGYSEFPSTNEYEVSATYANSSGTVLRNVATSYTAEFSNVYDLPVNVRPISITTTLDNGQVMQTQTDYETFTFPDSYGSEVATRLNPTEQRIYDYRSGSPGSLLKKIDYTYLHNVTPAYTNLNIVDKPSTVVVSNGSGSVASKTSYEYDNYSHANQPFLPSNAIQHDSTFTTTYTTRGNATAVSKWRSTDGAYLATTSQYDDAGNVLSTIDPLGRQTFFSYADAWASSACTPAGQSAAFVTRTTNAKGQIATSTNYACTGLTASTTDVNGQTTTSTYDFMGRPKVVTPPAGGGTKTMCYSDDPSGTCYSTSSLYIKETDAISGAINYVTTTLYNSLGRTKETQVNSDPDGVVYVDTQYDQDGRAYKVSNPYRSGDTVYWTTNGYDGLSRLTSVTKSDGSATATSYSGNATTITDEAGNKRMSQTNALSQLTGVWEDPTGLNYETDYQYDVLGNVLQVTQKGGSTNSSAWRVRTFTFNSLSQLLCSANPEIGSPLTSVATCPVTDTGSYIAGTTRYQYDNNGELISKTAPLENQTGSATVVTSYSYDVLGRVTGKTYSDGTPSVAYTYDGDAVTACTPPTLASPTNLKSHMSAMCDNSGATVWSYDALGRTLAEMRTIGNVTDQIGYTYYLNGAINTITYPLAGATTPFVMTYNVNAAGRTYSAVGSNGVTYAQVNSTWASGAANVSTLGSNIQITDTYNSRLQPLATTAEQISTTNTLFNNTYNFHLGSGDNGNLYGVQDGLDQLGLNRPNGSVNYGYDTLNRITSASTLGTACTMMAGGTLNWASTYTVDAWGNLIAQTPTLCSGEQLSSTASSRNQLAAANYDSAGNIIQYISSSYSYNAEGQMISGAGTTYIYDGSGERVMKPGKLYWKGVGSTALAETDATDHNPTQYIFFNGARIARIDAGATTPKYYIADHLGSTALVTDSLGNILNESLFFPYGVERVIQQNDSANNYKFTGKERNAETGLDDFGARYYVSTLGRFMSPDWDGKPVTVPYASFGDPQTLNLYSYVENGPLNKADADGHGPPDSNPSFGGNSLEHYYFGLDGVNDAACAELNGCGKEEQAQRQTEESGDEAAYVERVQDSAAQQQTYQHQPTEQANVPVTVAEVTANQPLNHSTIQVGSDNSVGLVPNSTAQAAAATYVQSLTVVPVPLSVPGHIETPDSSHKPVSSTTIYVTPDQAKAMRAYISKAENTPQRYDTTYHNCVNGFSVLVLRASGVNAPMDRTPGGLVDDLSK